MDSTQNIPRFDISEGFPIMFDKEKRKFFSCASDLRFDPGEWPNKIKLYNSDSGNEVTYFRTRSENKNGDILYYTYIPKTVNGMVAAMSNPENSDLAFKIFND